MNTEFYAALLGAIVGGIAATVGGVGLEYLRRRMTRERDRELRQREYVARAEGTLAATVLMVTELIRHKVFLRDFVENPGRRLVRAEDFSGRSAWESQQTVFGVAAGIVAISNVSQAHDFLDGMARDLGHFGTAYLTNQDGKIVRLALDYIDKAMRSCAVVSAACQLLIDRYYLPTPRPAPTILAFPWLSHPPEAR